MKNTGWRGLRPSQERCPQSSELAWVPDLSAGEVVPVIRGEQGSYVRVMKLGEAVGDGRGGSTEPKPR